MKIRFKINRKLIIFFITLSAFISQSIYLSLKPKLSHSPIPTYKMTQPTISDISITSKDVFKVERVIDGDTIVISGGAKVRYIGINAPEITVKKSGKNCFGKKASLKNKELVNGKYVYLEKDVSDKDKYGRLLRYVWLIDENVNNKRSLFINDYLVRQGYASVATYPPDVRYTPLLIEAQSEAREQKAGLWSDC